MTSSLDTSDPRPAPHGRGSAIEPPNRFLKAHAVPDYAAGWPGQERLRDAPVC